MLLSNLVINTSNSPSLNQEVIDKLGLKQKQNTTLLSEIEQNRKTLPIRSKHNQEWQRVGTRL